MLRVEEHSNLSQVYIEGEMTIYTAAELKEALMPVLHESKALEINLSNVSEIDSAGIQLLMLASKDRATRQQSLILTEHSSAVLDVFELMNLASYFNDPILLPSEKGI